VEARTHFLNVVLEAAQRFQCTSPDNHVVAQQTYLGIATHHAIGDHTTCHLADTGDAVDLTNLHHTDNFFAFLGRQHAGQCVTYVIHSIVDDVVVAQVNAVILRKLLGALLGTHVKADDDGVRCNRQVDVAFGNTTHSSVDDLNTDFVCGQLDQ